MVVTGSASNRGVCPARALYVTGQELMGQVTFRAWRSSDAVRFLRLGIGKFHNTCSVFHRWSFRVNFAQVARIIVCSAREICSQMIHLSTAQESTAYTIVVALESSKVGDGSIHVLPGVAVP